MKILASPRRKADNPFPQLLYDAVEGAGGAHRVAQFSLTKLLFGRWDLWHIHWPESVVWTASAPRAWLRFLRFWLALRIARWRGLRLFWTVHNLKSHESAHPRLERLLWHSFLAHLDGLICLSKSGQDQIRIHHPAAASLPTFVIPHGHYRGIYPDRLDSRVARQQLGLDPSDSVIAFVGQIRAYKNAPALIEAFRAVPDDDWRLLIAGRPLSTVLAQTLRDAAGDDRRVGLMLDYVPADALQTIFRSADLVVLPFKEILNSGSAILALSFNRPVLVPNKGAMAELGEQVGGDWVRVYDEPLDHETLRRALAWARDTRRDAVAPLDTLDWTVIGARTVAAYRAVLDHRAEDTSWVKEHRETTHIPRRSTK